MKYDELVAKVRDRTDSSEQQADALTRATVHALAERLAGGEPKDLLSQLPEELKDEVELEDEEMESGWDIPPDEFVHRVAEHAGIAYDQAEGQVRAVLATLREAVTEGQWSDIQTQLPAEYGELLDGRADDA
jgi:uncharacterized protein (DUF2267 family)